MIWLRPVVFLFTASAIACAPPASSSARTRNANVLTADEIAASQATTAYEAINNLRPAYLRARGSHTFDSAPQAPYVFVDGQKYGGLETLKTMSVQTIREIRYLNASDATTRYGTGYSHGIIEVFSR